MVVILLTAIRRIFPENFIKSLTTAYRRKPSRLITTLSKNWPMKPGLAWHRRGVDRPHAHFVTSTTHKSRRGPRGGIVMCQEKYGKQIDAMVFPGVQGGPLMHVIA